MKIIVAGDTHGNFMHMLDLINAARRYGCHEIVVVGDFGYWPHVPEGVIFLDELSRQLVSANLSLYFLDGNHDYPDLLKRNVALQIVRQNLLHMNRGASLTFGTTPFLTLGGAFSIDRTQRQKKMDAGGPVSWWPEEELTRSQVLSAIQSGTIQPPEIMLTHDAPHGAPIEKLTRTTVSESLAMRSRDHRIKVREVVDAVKPNILVHGHYHARLDYNMRIGNGQWLDCVALNCDPEARRSWFKVRGKDKKVPETVRDEDGNLNERGVQYFEESYIILEV